MIVGIENMADPIILPKVNLLGICAENGLEGDTAKIWNKITLTSDDPYFIVRCRAYVAH